MGGASTCYYYSDAHAGCGGVPARRIGSASLVLGQGTGRWGARTKASARGAESAALHRSTLLQFGGLQDAPGGASPRLGGGEGVAGQTYQSAATRYRGATPPPSQSILARDSLWNRRRRTIQLNYVFSPPYLLREFRLREVSGRRVGGAPKKGPTGQSLAGSSRWRRVLTTPRIIYAESTSTQDVRVRALLGRHYWQRCRGRGQVSDQIQGRLEHGSSPGCGHPYQAPRVPAWLRTGRAPAPSRTTRLGSAWG